MGATLPLNRELPTMSTCHFFFQYPLKKGTVSPCRPWSWVSKAVKTLYLLLVVILEGGVWSGVQLLWVTRVQSASFSVVSATEAWFWNHLYPLILHNLLTVSCSLATWHNRSSNCAHLFRVLTFSPGEGSGHSLQLTVYTEVSFLPPGGRNSFHQFLLGGSVRHLRGFLCRNTGFNSEVSAHFYGRDLEHFPGLWAYKQGARPFSCTFCANCCSHNPCLHALFTVLLVTCTPRDQRSFLFSLELCGKKSTTQLFAFLMEICLINYFLVLEIVHALYMRGQEQTFGDRVTKY